jgi:DNA-binding HxlR family transcriptional regulator
MQVSGKLVGMPKRAVGPRRMQAPLRSPCPIAGALDLIGDRWTLLVVRDLLFYGKRRFADFLSSPEGIATNILADRLERLERSGLVRRRRYREHPPREEYHPTARGRDLVPVLRELIHWGQRHVPGTAQRPPAEMDHGNLHRR